MNKMIVESQSSKESDEAVFGIDEIFMSRTDKRGVILYGNEVFRRVSRYDWDELIAAPHKVMRHPDMPKAIFHIFWDELKNGRRVGAYVKNRCKDGSFYWVFAVALPVDEGYLSIRFKPSSPMFDTVIEEYEKHRALERSEDLDAAESAERFTARLREMGHASYQTFMAEALAVELKARLAALKERAPSSFETVHALVPVWDKVQESSSGVFEAYESIRVTPLNMQTQAGKLNEDGKPLAVIATNFAILSDDMAEMMASFDEQSKAVLKSIYDNLFMLGSIQVLNEVVDLCKSDEMRGDASSKDSDIEYMEEQARLSKEQSKDAIRVIGRQLNNFVDLIGRVQVVLSGLSMTRVMCEIEAENLGETNARFAGILNELHMFQEKTDRCMRGLQGDLRKGQRMVNRRQHT